MAVASIATADITVTASIHYHQELIVMMSLWSLWIRHKRLDGLKKVIQLMHSHCFGKSPVCATERALLLNSILTPIPGIHTFLAANHWLTASTKDNRRVDGGILAYDTFKCVKKFTMEGNRYMLFILRSIWHTYCISCWREWNSCWIDCMSCFMVQISVANSSM